MADTSEVSSVAPAMGDAALGDVVTIAIGPEKKLFKVYKELICYHSKYFRTAYNGRWKESDKGVTLEDIEVGVFKIFVHWLYTQRVPRDCVEFFHIGGVGCEDPDIPGLLLLKACVFGDRFLAHDFKMLVHNTYIDLMDGCVGIQYKHIIYAFANLRDDIEILRMMVDLQCVCWDGDESDTEEEELQFQLPTAFLVRVMRRHCELKKKTLSENDIKAYTYHLHQSDKGDC